MQSRRLPKDIAQFKVEQVKQRKQIAEKALNRSRSASASSSSTIVHSAFAPLELHDAHSSGSFDPKATPLSPLYPETAPKALEPKKRHSKLNQLDEDPLGKSWIGMIQQASSRSIVISEILDSRTKDLVSVTQISDYVLSNELVSMALAMVAEDQQINRVLDELFEQEVSTGCGVVVRYAQLEQKSAPVATRIAGTELKPLSEL